MPDSVDKVEIVFGSEENLLVVDAFIEDVVDVALGEFHNDAR